MSELLIPMSKGCANKRALGRWRLIFFYCYYFQIIKTEKGVVSGANGGIAASLLHKEAVYFFIRGV